ncbi:hypothetical protein P5Y53_13720 [Dyella jiangningensis]|uniref:hypothetical protein n=1 Tax=Dyella jiangningensis TaxID=1379159 RepID=UPI00240EBFBF|nr:hypothetical protein [Dyella jiangningensis]MDG2538728.1 hypothetical protein [Dyella jiangningensis]
MHADAPPFVPWRDDAFLEQESSYALWNKVAWFSALPTLAIMRHYWKLKADIATRAKKGGQNLVDKRVALVGHHELVPCILGDNILNADRKIGEAMREEVPALWESDALRFCRSCILSGIHLRIHLHLAVSRCPLHDEALCDTCDSCGKRLSSAPGDHQAFRCGACGHGFLSNDMVQFGFTRQFRERVSDAHASVLQWLRYLECGIYREHLGESGRWDLGHALAHIDGRSLLLNAVHKSFSKLPAWMAQPEVRVENASIACIGLKEVRLAEAFRKCTPIGARFAKRMNHLIPRSMVMRGGPVTGDGRTQVAHYRQALRRVASHFLRTAGGSHPQCIDTPLLLDRERHDERRIYIDFELLNCCPIALGFWLWRMRSGTFFSSLVYGFDGPLVGVTVETMGGSMDLLFYAIERSHLHACVIAANEMLSIYRSKYRMPGVTALCLATLDGWKYGARHILKEELERLYFDPNEQELTFIRMDAMQLMQLVRCPGLEPFYRSVRQKLSATPTFNPKTLEYEDINVKSCWQGRANELISNLRPMDYDWVFFDSWQSSQTRLYHSDIRHARGTAAELKITPFECVDRAINRRADASRASCSAPDMP